MEKLIHTNNVVTSWLDDNEIVKISVLIAVVFLSIIGMSYATTLTVFLASMIPVLIIGVGRWYYVVKGKYLGVR